MVDGVFGGGFAVESEKNGSLIVASRTRHNSELLFVKSLPNRIGVEMGTKKLMKLHWVSPTHVALYFALSVSAAVGILNLLFRAVELYQHGLVESTPIGESVEQLGLLVGVLFIANFVIFFLSTIIFNGYLHIIGGMSYRTSNEHIPTITPEMLNRINHRLKNLEDKRRAEVIL